MTRGRGLHFGHIRMVDLILQLSRLSKRLSRHLWKMWLGQGVNASRNLTSTTPNSSYKAISFFPRVMYLLLYRQYTLLNIDIERV